MSTIHPPPRRWCWLIGLLLLTAPFRVSYSQAPPPVTTIYIIRHAEKLDTTPDTPLSPAGKVRAKALGHVLKDAQISAIFVTNFQRSQQTAAPLATATGLTPIVYPATTPSAAINQILANHIGGRILVVGHSNTVDDLASGLGANGVGELAETRFDRMFIVQRTIPGSLLQRLRYGTPTP